MKFLEHPNARFWFYNILFWIIFYAISICVSPPFLIYNFSTRILLCTVFMVWIMLFTGAYRWVYYRFNFENQSYSATVIQTIVSALILVCIDVFVRFYINPRLGLLSIIKEDSNLPLTRVLHMTATDFAQGSAAREQDLDIYVGTTNIFVQVYKFCFFIIWTIGFNFYNYSQRLRQKEVEKLAAENRAKDLELINLRSQLNPHFLFNALNSIHSLAMMKKDTASDAVLLLSDLMRYTLNYEKRDVVPLSEEIEVVEKYLQLEKIRFGKKLNAELDISDATLDLKIPPIIVQTLVENAIKHGLKDSVEGVFIKINSQLTDDFLTINIINSGRLKKEDLSVSEPKNSGIGVENTRRRLQMIYGERATFDLQNLNEKEVIATLKLPVNS
jgi:two-component system, LytTR family, sensor kinase